LAILALFNAALALTTTNLSAKASEAFFLTTASWAVALFWFSSASCCCNQALSGKAAKAALAKTFLALIS
jgi:hypothetical protein